MKAVLQTIRILVIILLIKNIRCQEGFSDQDILRLQQLASNDGQVETITSYSTNILQRDPNSQSVSSVSVQYHMTDDASKNDEHSRGGRGRSRKVYRIKNPFQQQLDETEQQQNSDIESHDSGTGASNQYAAMQYSLPPDDFLHQMRAENQYFQQQQQQQLSTQAPNLGYTATPQPQQYQYSTISPSSYDNTNQQSNQLSQLDPKLSQGQGYHHVGANYQYNGQNSYSIDNVQSTASPLYLSTSLSNNQYIGTPANPYVSSSAPIFLSSPSNLQQYVSSPLSPIQTGSPDYGINRGTTTLGSNSLSYDSNDQSKHLQIDHYDNSANGVRYPPQQQYLNKNDYPSSTQTPTSSPYSDQSNQRDQWQNSLSSVNSKSLQDVSLSQYQNYPQNYHQDSRSDSNLDTINSDTHRIGNVPAANNVFLNYAQPDYQIMSNIKQRTRDLEQETSQPDSYSHGDYGWKMNGKKPVTVFNHETYAPGNQQRYLSSDGPPVSQMTFHMDTGKSYNYDQISKSETESLEAQEFAKAAAKAHENLKQQQLYANTYANNFNGNNPLLSNSPGSIFYGNNDKQKSKTYGDSINSYGYSNSQTDLITLSPYYYTNSRDTNMDNKVKQPFDHAKALKNIVPIDVSNVVPNSDVQIKNSAGLDINNKYNLQNYGRDQVEQNLKQYYKSVTDSHYKDKNTIYGFNIKTKPEDGNTHEGYRQTETKMFFPKQQQQESYYNQGIYGDNKRFTDGSSQSLNYPSQALNQDSLISAANSQQQGLQRPQNQMSSNDIANLLKLNDIPYRLTQSIPSDALRLHNSNYDQGTIPTPLPVRLNQNVDNHQIDVATSILNKLMLNNKQSAINNQQRPEIDSQTGGLLSTINGFRVANPFNVDLKLVAEMLKGKPLGEDTSAMSQFNKPVPLKLDVSQLQQLLIKNENTGNIASLNDGFGALNSPFFEIYNSGRFPYQGVKYSRSEEEEENIPITDSTNNHPIGAVIEQDDLGAREVSTGSELIPEVDTLTNTFSENRAKFSPSRMIGDRHRHPNSLLQGRHSFQRRYPKSNGEPYPLLKPPPPHTSRSWGKIDKYNRGRRGNRRKMARVLKSEPMFESESEENLETVVPTLLRPPPPIAEDKSDSIQEQGS